MKSPLWRTDWLIKWHVHKYLAPKKSGISRELELLGTKLPLKVSTYRHF